MLVLNSFDILCIFIGMKTPRYLLFGETINTANLVEALGSPMRIHVSDATYGLLEDEHFDLEMRDVMQIKGYGSMVTFWLNGRLDDCPVYEYL